jgi:hypothetical protein
MPPKSNVALVLISPVRESMTNWEVAVEKE